jgi:hypothetical protein
MAEREQADMSEQDLCAVVRGWPLCVRVGHDYLITTHCQLPNGSLVKVRVRRSGDQWIVSDGGAALDEALASGVEKPVFGMNVRRAIRNKGLSFVDGRIETPRIGPESLFNAVVVIANTARDIAETLIFVGSNFAEDTLEKRARRILIGRFHSWVLSKPVIIHGASEREHKFENALDLPDGRKVLVDVVKHQGNSINSSVVANLDVQRLGNPKFVQRIVFDPSENWKNEEIALLGVGATPVALPSLGDAIERIAA